jgi:hypothetical protein
MTDSEWANNLLQDQKFLDVFSVLKAIEMNTIANSNSDDYDIRQTSYVKYQALQAVLTHIESMASQRNINEKRFKIL